MKQPPRAYGRLFALHSARTTWSIPGAGSNIIRRHLYAPWLLRPLTLKLPSAFAQLPLLDAQVDSSKRLDSSSRSLTVRAPPARR
jgi:hypothetical protein